VFNFFWKKIQKVSFSRRTYGCTKKNLAFIVWNEPFDWRIPDKSGYRGPTRLRLSWVGMGPFFGIRKNLKSITSVHEAINLSFVYELYDFLAAWMKP
jgi:hypothetical protein